MTLSLYTADLGYASFPGERIPHPALLVDDGLIVAFGPIAAVLPLAPQDLPSIDLGAVVLMPGFIDAHVHLAFDGGADPIAAVRRSTDEEVHRIARANVGLLLEAGVTTARDLGSRGLAITDLRGPIAVGELAGPTLLLAGSPITTPDGHCWFLGGAVADLPAALDVVRRQRDEGATWVKVMMSGGFLTETTNVRRPQFDLAAITAITDLARASGMGVATHAHGVEAVRAAALAGVTTIEHATFIGEDGIDFAEDVVATMSANGVAVCPTVNAETMSYPEAYGIGAMRRLVEMHRAGVDVVMGTDAGVQGVTGDLYAAGLATLVDAGFTPAEVLGFATTGAGRVLGEGETAGRLAPGFRADAVALSADPVADIAAAAEPTWVLAAGRVTAPQKKERVA